MGTLALTVMIIAMVASLILYEYNKHTKLLIWCVFI